MNLYDRFDKPFHTLHIDHVGPFEVTNKKYKYILVVVEAFSKFCRFYPTKSTNTNEVINSLKKYFRDYSVPTRIISDRGTCFTSHQFKKFLNELGIIQVLNATSSPQSNGQAERVNRSLVPMLAKLRNTENGKNWDSVLSNAEFVFNNTINRSVNNTPSMLLFGVNQKFENDKIQQLIDELNNDNRDLSKIRQEASQEIERSQLKSKEYFDSKRRAAHKYGIGDLVFLKNNSIEPGISQKLLPRFKGPYVVTKILPNDRYECEDLPGQQISNRPFRGVSAPFNMKPYE